MAAVKLRYEIDLANAIAVSAVEDAEVRPITRADLVSLADLMLEAYRGTIDYEDETYEEAVAEVESFLGDRPLLEHSFLAEVAGATASAVLVTTNREDPFIAYVMTHPAHKNRGLGRYLVSLAAASLADSGYDRVAPHITEGNVPSEALFRSVGARLVTEA